MLVKELGPGGRRSPVKSGCTSFKCCIWSLYRSYLLGGAL